MDAPQAARIIRAMLNEQAFRPTEIEALRFALAELGQAQARSLLSALTAQLGEENRKSVRDRRDYMREFMRRKRAAGKAR